MKIIRKDLSVVVPSYKSVDTLCRALDSIRMQTLQPAFVHVIDDHSPTLDSSFVNSYIAIHQLNGWYAHRLPRNVGAGTARDFGVRSCTTSYVAFLDADDAWSVSHISDSFSVIDKYDLALFGGQVIKLSLGEQSSAPMPKQEKITFVCMSNLLFKCLFLTSTVVVKRSSYFFSGGFLPGQRLSEDYSLWLRIVACKDNRCAITNLVHAQYDDTDASSSKRLSNNHWSHELSELSNFRLMFRSGHITRLQLLSATLFSLLKYVKRLAWRFI